MQLLLTLCQLLPYGTATIPSAGPNALGSMQADNANASAHIRLRQPISCPNLFVMELLGP